MAPLCKRRDNDRGNPRAGPPAIDFRWRNVIPASSVFVIRDEDGAVFPICSLAYGFHHACHALLTPYHRCVSRVFVVKTQEFDERHGGKFPLLEIFVEVFFVPYVRLFGRSAVRIAREVDKGMVVILERSVRTSRECVLVA